MLFLLGKKALYLTEVGPLYGEGKVVRPSGLHPIGAMMIRNATLAGGPMKISLILPLYDRRNAGWSPLESALNQTMTRGEYELIVVVGRAFGNEATTDAHADELLRQCDAVVNVDVDTNSPEQEVPLLLAGYERSAGDVLFFMEGHTELDPDCCAMIAAHFRDNPRSRIAWAPRIHRSTTSLGLLIGMHSKRHERRVWQQGGFWLGANSVITREYFEHLGRLEAGYMRFCERVLCERVWRENVAIGRLPLPLSIHYDDMPLSQLIDVAATAGEAKFRYYNSAISGAGAGPVQVRHGIYLIANRAVGALILFPVACLLRGLFLRVAVAANRISRNWAYRFYVAGLGFADLSGFCRARIRAAGVRRPHALTAPSKSPL